MVYSTRRFVVCLTLCHFVLVFFSPFSIAITSLGEERANLGAFRAFARFELVWICRFPLPLGVWEGLRFVIVALPGLFSYLFFIQTAALPRHQEEEETDKSKQAQSDQTLAKPKTYRQAPAHWLKFYEKAVIESEARTAVVQNEDSRNILRNFHLFGPKSI